jgi:2-polyprenyl-3-methyl-5-hydroxy-6-metoxy-1,4-benzoquinol methylase/ribosomal protein S15P/S13E
MKNSATNRICWCGCTSKTEFGADYGVCTKCGTLVLLKPILKEVLEVNNDETDFYGKKYWLDHQEKSFGYVGLEDRARFDLSERNLHWLKVLLKYALPPASTIELGCSHASFVALLNMMGFNSFGVEMSPWIVAYGKKTFGVPVYVGPVECLDIEAGSLDVIILMDVLEHLPDPVGTMSYCISKLSTKGSLLIQTPEFKNEMNYQALLDFKEPFLEQLKTEEHLFLFTKSSATQLFKLLGLEYIVFEPAIFEKYDMFLVASKSQLRVNDTQTIDKHLLSTPTGRICLALLDLREKEQRLVQQLQSHATDLNSRDEQVENLTSLVISKEAEHQRHIDALSKSLVDSDIDRTARGEQINILTKMVQESEADRVNRGEQIAALTQMLHNLQAKVKRWHL